MILLGLLVPVANVEIPRGLETSQAMLQEAPPKVTPEEGVASGSPVTGATELVDGNGVSSDERDEWRARERELLARIADLETELAREQARAFERQETWIAYTKLLQGFELPGVPMAPDFIANALAAEVDPLAEIEARRRARAELRGDEIERVLRALLIVEGVRTIDFLEVGLVGDRDGRPFTGPVVARILDDRGRLVGSYKAERMRLEVSHAARTVTLVLEDGFEARRGFKTPFSGGARRITVPVTDPGPWLEKFSDLVDPRDLDPFLDDGTWDARAVSRELRGLLRAGPAGLPKWEIAGLGGVREDRLRDVQLVEKQRGEVKRRVFADSCEIVLRGSGGVELILREGTVRREGRTAPFLNGVYRVRLPFADIATWKKAAIPIVDA